MEQLDKQVCVLLLLLLPSLPSLQLTMLMLPPSHQGGADTSRLEELKGEIAALSEVVSQAKNNMRRSDREAKQKEMVEDLKRKFTHVHGRLVDLVKPTERKYGAALARVLGKNAEAVVVDREEDARECIKHLHAEHLGVAEFLPLDTLRVKDIDERLRTLGGFLAGFLAGGTFISVRCLLTLVTTRPLLALLSVQVASTAWR